MKNALFAVVAMATALTVSIPAFAQMSGPAPATKQEANEMKCQNMMDKAQSMQPPADPMMADKANKQMAMAKMDMDKGKEKDCKMHMHMAMGYMK